MTDIKLQNLFTMCSAHQVEHACGGYPYADFEMLRLLVTLHKPRRILEVGTGLGFSSLCMALSHDRVVIDTIDQDITHLNKAKELWTQLSVNRRITMHHGKAEAILPSLTATYDLIFFDGYVPQKKFLEQFDKLLHPGGLLITANLFIRDNEGGSFLRQLRNPKKWLTGVFSDTAISYKL